VEKVWRVAIGSRGYEGREFEYSDQNKRRGGKRKQRFVKESAKRVKYKIKDQGGRNKIPGKGDQFNKSIRGKVKEAPGWWHQTAWGY